MPLMKGCSRFCMNRASIPCVVKLHIIPFFFNIAVFCRITLVPDIL